MQDEFRRAINSVVKMPDVLITGIVKAVDLQNCTCDVMPSDGGALYNDVRLRSVVNDNTMGIFITPKKNSEVVIGSLGNNADDLVVVVYSEVDKIVVKSAKLNLELDFSDASPAVKINIADKTKITVNENAVNVDCQGTVTFNGGGYGGLVISDTIAGEVNKVVTRVNALQTILAAFIVGYNAHLPTPVTPMPTVTLPPLIPVVSGNLQDVKVKH